MIRFVTKLLVLALLLSKAALASVQILDPEIYQSEIDLLQASDGKLHHSSLPLITQDMFNAQVSSMDLSEFDRAFLNRMSRNTYDDGDYVFNAQLKTFLSLHNSRPSSYLDLNAQSDPFYTSSNNIYIPGNFGGVAGQFYVEAFRFFSFDIKPYFLFHDVTGVSHTTIKEMYGSIHINKLSIDIGKARLHWGYGAYQPMVLSDDARPFPMIRLRSNEEIQVGNLGKMRFEIFYGWLDRFRTYPHSDIIGSTFSIQPSDRLHFHLDQTVLFGGTGAPTNNPLVFFNETFVDSTINPANRNFTFGARYRIPKIEIEPYLDIYVEDCCRKPPINPHHMLNLLGVYIPPRNNGKFDFSLEWARTNYITYRHAGFAYIQSGRNLGHPIGPDGTGIYGVTRYFHSKKLQLENLLAYEVRGVEARALSYRTFVDIRVVEPTFQDEERRYRTVQSASYFVTPYWKWTAQAGLEYVNDLNYRIDQNKWNWMFGLESAINF